MTIANRVVVVTGSTRGIGRTIAEYAARAGAQLVVSGRTEDASREAADFIRSFGGQAVGCSADVRDPAQLEKLFACAIAEFGAVHAWVNNAGVTEGLVPVDQQSYECMRDVVETNLLGHLYGARVVVPYFREHGGILLNLVGRGYRGEPSEFMAVYAATKAAILSLTRSLAAENRDVPNLSIHALAPGMIETDLHREIAVSDRMKGREHVRDLAMDAFGSTLSRVGESVVDILAQEPGKRSGQVYALVGPVKRITGIARMAYWGATGRMRPRP
ncbi:MAG: SDR family oxidoreductase [Coriobacteriales bacterium]|nr:SDR family oxidoreductase [Coriobacteriales bacterium]